MANTNGLDHNDAWHAALCGKYRDPNNLRVTGTSNAAPTLAFTNSMFFEYRSTVDCYYAVGATEVTATNGRYLAKGDTDWVAMRGETNVCSITDGGTGYLQIVEKKA